MKALFVWTKTNSLMGNDRWPFYGSLAVATYANYYGVEVEILDLRVESSDLILLNKIISHDLIFVVFITSDMVSVKQVIRVCRQAKKPIILGGPHVSAVSSDILEKYIQQGCIIVKNDGISVIEEIINDFKLNKLKNIYQGTDEFAKVVKAIDLVTPNRNLLPKNIDYLNSLITSLGCPNKCTFCFDANSGTNRRNPYKIVEEISKMDTKKIIGFFDDNIIGQDPKGAEYLADVIINSGINIKWFANADISSILYPDILTKLRKAGMISIYIGLESIYIDTIRLAGKMGLVKKVWTGFGNQFPEVFTDDHLIELYVKIIDKLHDLGFIVYCGLIVGWVHESAERIKHLQQFAINYPDVPWLSIATPYPGTGLQKILHNRGITIEDYELGNYDTNHFVYEHPLEPNKNFYKSIQEFYLSLGSNEVIKNKLARLVNSKFDRAAVSGVADNLYKMSQKANSLYSNFF